MKEKFTFNDIRPFLIAGEPIVVFKGGWKEENVVYEDSLIYDDKKYQNFIKKYGDAPIKCISTSVNINDLDWTNIAFLI